MVFAKMVSIGQNLNHTDVEHSLDEHLIGFWLIQIDFFSSSLIAHCMKQTPLRKYKNPKRKSEEIKMPTATLVKDIDVEESMSL